MLISEIMTSGVVTVQIDDTLERIRTIFEQSRFHHLIVLDGARVAGVLSDRDLLKHLSPFLGNAHMERAQDERTLTKRAHQIMTRRPVVAFENTTIEKACRDFVRHNVGCLPVVSRDGQLYGIVTWKDLLRHFMPEEDAKAA